MVHALVLVADGEIEALARTQAILSSAGYLVEIATNGKAALERVMARAPEVLITEILMEDGDGIELICDVKRAGLNPRIIAVTSRRFLGTLDLLNLANKLGADAVLEKPLGADTLLAAVSSLAKADAGR